MSFLPAVETLRLEYRTVIHGSVLENSLSPETKVVRRGSRHESMNGSQSLNAKGPTAERLYIATVTSIHYPPDTKARTQPLLSSKKFNSCCAMIEEDQDQGRSALECQDSGDVVVAAIFAPSHDHSAFPLCTGHTDCLCCHTSASYRLEYQCSPLWIIAALRNSSGVHLERHACLAWRKQT